MQTSFAINERKKIKLILSNKFCDKKKKTVNSKVKVKKEKLFWVFVNYIELSYLKKKYNLRMFELFFLILVPMIMLCRTALRERGANSKNFQKSRGAINSSALI